MAAAIETWDLGRSFGPVVALDGLNLRVEEGEIFGFLGPNGAGKTTTIRLLLDLIRPTHGRAAILGHDCQSDSIEARRNVGYLAGEVLLYERMRGRELVQLIARLRGLMPDWPHVHELAERLELDLARHAGAYSKGNRQKLGIVLALMHRPRVCLLDEPTAGLDPLVQRAAHELFREHAHRGGTVFFSSHVMSEVEQLCERVGILRAGRIVEVARLSDLRGVGARHVRVRFAGASPSPGAIQPDGVRELRRERDEVEFAISGDVDPLLKALVPFHVIDISTEQPTLEEVLLTYYDREQPA